MYRSGPLVPQNQTGDVRLTKRKEDEVCSSQTSVRALRCDRYGRVRGRAGAPWAAALLLTLGRLWALGPH